MAVGAAVLFKFEKPNDLVWLGMIGALEEMGAAIDKKEANTAVIAALSVKDYSLKDHQFIQFTLEVKNSKDIVIHFPRAFIIGITEGVSPEKLRKMGF